MSSANVNRPISFFRYLFIRVLPFAAVIMGLAGMVGLSVSNDIAEEKSNESLSRQSAQTAIIVQLRLGSIIEQTKNLSNNALLVNGLIDHEGRDNYLPAFFGSLRFAGHDDANISFTDYKGRQLFSNQIKQSNDLNLGNWGKTVIDEGHSWSRLTSSALTIIEPIRIEKNAEGAVIVSLNNKEVSKLFDVGVQFNETVVVDAAGRVLYASKAGFGVPGELLTQGGKRAWLDVSAPLKAIPGVVIHTVQWQDVALADQKWIQNFLFSGIVSTLLVIGFAVALTALIAKRETSRLAHGVQKISKTHNLFQRVKPSGPAELYALGDDFNTMLDTLQRTTTSYEYVEGIISNTSEGIITIDDNSLIETYNNAAENIFGYRAKEVIGRNISILMPATESEELEVHIKNSASTTPQLTPNAQNFDGQRQDGILFPIELNVTPMMVNGQQKFIAIIRDISERREIEQTKNQFVSTVSHELRTPLTSIRGSLSMIESGALKDPEKISRMIHLAVKNTERLINLVNDLLDIEKLQSGDLEFHLSEVSIHNLAEDSIEANQPYAKEHGVEFRVTETLDNACVHGDSDRLMQVMANLLSNAAKFSPSGSVVEVSNVRKGELIRVSVSDKGPGISQEFQQKIFQRFTQADSSDTRQKGGTGLGLSISKAIIEKLGGSIGFDSEPGKGATFYFELPEMRNIEIAPVAVTNILDAVSINQETITNCVKRVLHLEDDTDLCQVMEALIGDRMDYISTPTLSEACQIVTDQKFDVIIIDPGLRVGNGLDILPKLAGTPNEHAALIVYSSDVVSEQVFSHVNKVLLKSKATNEELFAIIHGLSMIVNKS